MRNLFIIIICFFCISCNSNPKPQQQVSTSVKPAFSLPTIPMTITDQASQISYMCEHYWNNFSFADSTSTQIENLNKIFIQWINLISSQPQNKSHELMRAFMKKTQENKTTFEFFSSLSETILHNPNSQMRNEELYIPVLESVIESPHTDSLMTLRPKHLLEFALKNRVGEKATNFEYMLPNGSTYNMHALKSPYTLLMFNNPGCEACGVIISYIENSELFKTMIQNKELTTLAVFPDAQIEEWEKYQSSIPKNWINGYDKKQKLNGEELYDLKAIPTLYLLDKDKKILLKDPDVHVVEQYLTKKG